MSSITMDGKSSASATTWQSNDAALTRTRYIPQGFGNSEESQTASKAVDVAWQLIGLAASEEEPEYLTPLHLQKLLYFSQGWSLAMRDQALFKEGIEAWALGPVVPNVFEEFKQYRQKPIAPKQLPGSSTLSDDEREFLSSFWNEYKKFSSNSLRQLLNKQSLWIAARKGLRPEEKCAKKISQSAMKAYFKKLLKA